MGVAALVLSLGWLAGGAAVFGWGSGQASELRVDLPWLAMPESIRATAGRLWDAIGADGPALSEDEISVELHQAVMQAYATSDAQFRAARNYHPLHTPPELRGDAIQRRLADAIAAAELAADRQRQRLALLPSDKRPEGRGARLTAATGLRELKPAPEQAAKNAAPGGN